MEAHHTVFSVGVGKMRKVKCGMDHVKNFCGMVCKLQNVENL